MKSIRKDKRGILGFEVVKAVLIGLLILAVLAIAVFAVLVPLEETTQTQFTEGFTKVNESFTAVGNQTNQTVADSLTAVNFAFNNASLVCTNASNDVLVPTSNWTAYPNGNFIGSDTSCQGVLGVAGGTGFCGWDWQCTYTYSFTSNNDAAKITDNVTSGTTQFFEQVPTFMTLLGVVVLILIIAIVIVAVGRFEDSGFEGGKVGGDGGNTTGPGL